MKSIILPNDIECLLDRPIWQLTGKEFVSLVKFAFSDDSSASAPVARRITVAGVHALADYLSCCDSTIYSLLRNHVLDAAIVSKIGKKSVFDAEMARDMAEQYLNDRRMSATNINNH